MPTEVISSSGPSYTLLRQRVPFELVPCTLSLLMFSCYKTSRLVQCSCGSLVSWKRDNDKMGFPIFFQFVAWGVGVIEPRPLFVLDMFLFVLIFIISILFEWLSLEGYR